MHHLNILLNLIISTYFNDSACIIHYHDDGLNYAHTHSVPIVNNRNLHKDDLLNDEHKLCKHFLLQSKNAKSTFESTENMIESNDLRMYNNRKYIIIVDSQDAFTDFFNSNYLTFVRDVLVIYELNHNVGRVDETTDFIKFGKDYLFNVEDDILDFDLYTHKYVGLDEYNTAVHLNTWFSGNLSFKFGNCLFPDKIADQEGRELRTHCYTNLAFALCGSEPPIGVEHNIMVKYTQRFNMSLIWDVHTTDETDYHGFLNAKNQDYLDVVYGGYPENDYYDMVNSVLYTYEVSVPLPNIKYGFFMFLEVFTLYVWLSIFVLYIMVRGLVYFYDQQVKMSSSRSSISHLNMYGLLINHPAELPSDSGKFIKYILMLMLVTGVLLVVAYNSRLASVMVTPILENDINTLSELATSDLGLIFFDKYYKIMENDERQIYKALFEKITALPRLYDFERSESMLSSRKYAVARYRQSNGDYYEHPNYLWQMQGRFKPITPELFTNYNCILLKKNSMHTYELQKLVKTAQETGLMKFWEEAGLRRNNGFRFQQYVKEYSQGNQNVILNRHHLKGLFAFWGCGMVISFVAFLIELFRKKELSTVESQKAAI